MRGEGTWRCLHEMPWATAIMSDYSYSSAALNQMLERAQEIDPKFLAARDPTVSTKVAWIEFLMRLRPRIGPRLIFMSSKQHWKSISPPFKTKKQVIRTQKRIWFFDFVSIGSFGFAIKLQRKKVWQNIWRLQKYEACVKMYTHTYYICIYIIYIHVHISSIKKYKRICGCVQKLDIASSYMCPKSSASRLGRVTVQDDSSWAFAPPSWLVAGHVPTLVQRQPRRLGLAWENSVCCCVDWYAASAHVIRRSERHKWKTNEMLDL